MSAYTWLKLVHILSAIVAVGANLTYFVWLQRAKTSPEHAGFALEGIWALDRKVANPAYIVLPVTGIAMVLVGDLGFSTFWIATAIGLFVAMAVFAGIFFTPTLRRQLELALAGAHRTEEYAGAAQRTIVSGVITMALIVAIVYLMVMKPG